jgi:hypothetical protein
MCHPAGIEKSLKFVQSLSQVAAVSLVASSPDQAVGWDTAKSHVNLGEQPMVQRSTLFEESGQRKDT